MKKFNPLRFLQPLGAGGLAVSFFMYIMFMTEHKGLPIPTFDTLKLYFLDCPIFNWEFVFRIDPWSLFRLLIIFSMLWILFFVILHIVTLVKSFKQFFKFKKTKEYKELTNSNFEITLITIPLTLAMTMNVMFIFWAVFVPWLRDIIEYIFPFAIAMFVAIWVLAITIYWIYFAKRLTKWWLDTDNNNSLSQMISVFAFAMVGVWLAWPAAMSHNLTTSATAMFFSIFFLVITFVLLIIKLIIWFQAMFSKWLNKKASPSLRIMIPIITLFGISLVRHKFALYHWFEAELEKISMFVLTSILLSIQLFFWFLWYIVMKKNNYFTDYLSGSDKDVGSFALICPWVAIFVFSMFFIHQWLVFPWILEKFGIFYFILLLPLIFVQIKTVRVMLQLWKRLKEE